MGEAGALGWNPLWLVAPKDPIEQGLVFRALKASQEAAEKRDQALARKIINDLGAAFG